MSFITKIVVLAVIAIAAIFFGAKGLFEEPSDAATKKPALPPATTIAPKPTTTPTTTPTTKPVTTPTTTPTATPTATVPPKPAQGTMLKEWLGIATRTTESFTIATAPWQVSWLNNPQMALGQSIGSLQILVLDASKNPIAIVANTTEKKVELANIQQTGTFTLQINALNTQWTVQVWAKQ